ncbi:hypothetical protein [Marinicella sp. W31]|uniref:hypothetical protein n=1 Tax=Marinicella sp. W31 TaxID=3023713 RepID=UPI003756661C
MKKFFFASLFVGVMCFPMQAQGLQKLCFLHGKTYKVIGVSEQCPLHPHSVHRDTETSATGQFKIKVSNTMFEYLSYTNFFSLVDLNGHQINIGPPSFSNQDSELNPECYSSELHDPYR